MEKGDYVDPLPWNEMSFVKRTACAENVKEKTKKAAGMENLCRLRGSNGPESSNKQINRSVQNATRLKAELCEARIKLQIHAHNLEKDKLFGAHTGHLAKSAVWFLEVLNDGHSATIANLEQGEYAGQLMPPLDHAKEPMGIKFASADERYFSQSELQFFRGVEEGKDPPLPISHSLRTVLRDPTPQQRQDQADQDATSQLIRQRREETENVATLPQNEARPLVTAALEVASVRGQGRAEAVVPPAAAPTSSADGATPGQDEFAYMDAGLRSFDLDAAVASRPEPQGDVQVSPTKESPKRSLPYDPSDFTPIPGTFNSYNEAVDIVNQREGNTKRKKKSYDSHGNEHYNRKKYNTCGIPPNAIALQLPLGREQKETVARILVKIMDAVGDGEQRTDKQVSKLLRDRWNVEHYVELLDFNFGYGGVMSAEVGLRLVRDMVKNALRGKGIRGFASIILTPSQVRGPNYELSNGEMGPPKKRGRKPRTDDPLLPIANIRMEQVRLEKWSSYRIYQHLKKFKEAGFDVKLPNDRDRRFKQLAEAVHDLHRGHNRSWWMQVQPAVTQNQGIVGQHQAIRVDGAGAEKEDGEQTEDLFSGVTYVDL